MIGASLFMGVLLQVGGGVHSYVVFGEDSPKPRSRPLCQLRVT